MLCIVLSVGTIITALIRSRLRRQEAQQSIDILLENKNSVMVVSENSSQMNA